MRPLNLLARSFIVTGLLLASSTAETSAQTFPRSPREFLPRVHFASATTNSAGREARTAQRLLGINGDSLGALRASVVAYGRVSSRGIAGVAMTLQVLDALAAPTTQGYREALRQIPISIVGKHRSPDGTKLLVRYQLRGEFKAKEIGGSRVAVGHSEQRLEASELLVVQSTRRPSGPAEPAPSELASGVNCEFTDADGVSWNDECATEQEKDEALVMYLATDAEVTAADGEATDLCNANQELCLAEPYEENELTGNAKEFTVAHAQRTSLLSDDLDRESYGLASAGDLTTAYAVLARGCGLNWGAMGVALLNYGSRTLTLHGAIFGASTKLALAGAGMGYLAAAGGVYIAARFLHSCLQ